MKDQILLFPLAVLSYAWLYVRALSKGMKKYDDRDLIRRRLKRFVG